MRQPKVSAEQARKSYNQACEDFADGKITLDELMNAARQLEYSQRFETNFHG